MNFSFSEAGINRQIINFSLQTCFVQINFFQLTFVIGKFLINSCCIGLYVNTLFNLFCKILIAYFKKSKAALDDSLSLSNVTAKDIRKYSIIFSIFSVVALYVAEIIFNTLATLLLKFFSSDYSSGIHFYFENFIPGYSRDGSIANFVGAELDDGSYVKSLNNTAAQRTLILRKMIFMFTPMKHRNTQGRAERTTQSTEIL